MAHPVHHAQRLLKTHLPIEGLYDELKGVPGTRDPDQADRFKTAHFTLIILMWHPHLSS